VTPVKKAIVVLLLTCAWVIAVLLLTYVASWSLGTILLNSPIVYEVTAATNLILAIGSFIAFFFLARRVLAEPKESDDL
jgi:hypothetical protein